VAEELASIAGMHELALSLRTGKLVVRRGYSTVSAVRDHVTRVFNDVSEGELGDHSMPDGSQPKYTKYFPYLPSTESLIITFSGDVDESVEQEG
jgi:hypothetical protein